MDHQIVVLTGMRRVGKTTAVHWLFDQVPSPNKIFLDMERMSNRVVFRESNADLILNFLTNRGLDLNQPLMVVLDEIQYAPNLPDVIKALSKRRKIKFLLTSSCSFHLKDFLSEPPSENKVVFEMFPLSFAEFLDFRGIHYQWRTLFEQMRFDLLEYENLKRVYDEYIQFGGLPDVVLEPKPEKKLEIIQNILSSYITMDMRSIAEFKKVDEFQQLLKVLALRIGNKLDMSRLSMEVGISRPTFNEYLEFLKRSYLIYGIPAFRRPEETSVLGRKWYFRDHGMAEILAQPGEVAIFENAVMNQLSAYCAVADQRSELNYLFAPNENENDFVLSRFGVEPVGFEMKYRPVKTDVQRLNRVANKNGLASSWVIGRYPTRGFGNFLWGGSIL